MVTRIISGQSIRGLLNYNESKVAEQQATLILASRFGTDIDRLDFKAKLNRFENLTILNSRVKITDKEVKRLIQLAMVPSKEVYEKLQKGAEDELSSHFTNMVNTAFEYAMISPTQQDATTKGTLYGAYNSVSGYFQNVRNYKSDENKFKSIMYGTGLQRSQTAFDLCTDFAKNGNSALN